MTYAVSIERDIPWYKRALDDLGTPELLADGTLNPRVRNYFINTNFPAYMVNKKTAWCAAALCTWLELGGVLAHPHSAAAKHFIDFGVELKTPKLGAICVWERGRDSQNKPLYHVNLFASDRGNEWKCLGGNQANAVRYSMYTPDRLVALRWPFKTT